MPKSLKRLLIAVTIAWAGLAPGAPAQDVQYWNATYGTKALLLGGIVIGSVGDFSAVYYNPAALGLLERTEVILSGSGYQYSKLTLENSVGSQGSLTSSSLAAVPGMFAGEIPISSDKTRLGYSVLTRLRFNGRVDGRGLSPDTALHIGSLGFFRQKTVRRPLRNLVVLTLARATGPLRLRGHPVQGRAQPARALRSVQALDTNWLAGVRGAQPRFLAHVVGLPEAGIGVATSRGAWASP
jgi:hypothetical protein